MKNYDCYKITDAIRSFLVYFACLIKKPICKKMACNFSLFLFKQFLTAYFQKKWTDDDILKVLNKAERDLEQRRKDKGVEVKTTSKHQQRLFRQKVRNIRVFTKLVYLRRPGCLSTICKLLRKKEQKAESHQRLKRKRKKIKSEGSFRE